MVFCFSGGKQKREKPEKSNSVVSLEAIEVSDSKANAQTQQVQQEQPQQIQSSEENKVNSFTDLSNVQDPEPTKYRGFYGDYDYSHLYGKTIYGEETGNLYATEIEEDKKQENNYSPLPERDNELPTLSQSNSESVKYSEGDLTSAKEKDALSVSNSKNKQKEITALSASTSSNSVATKYTEENAKALSITNSKMAHTKEQSMYKIAQQEMVRDWNMEFQKIGFMPDSAEKYLALEILASEFADTAISYARIIISELILPNSQKTIPPISIGGVAGGEKYVMQGILFKFALDTLLHPKTNFWMYGGYEGRDDEAAIKAAGRELAALKAHWFTLVPGLHYPLMILIDYKGFRMVASCLLPIGKDTLIYGSCDGGLTVHADNEEMNAYMKVAGETLRLKGHFVGNDKKAKIYGPGDIEGHLGYDGRFYVLDFGRLFPPEDPRRTKSKPRSVYYKHLRGEFMRFHGIELVSSDVFTAWDSDPEERVENMKTAIKLSDLLHNELIPKFAKSLDEHPILSTGSSESINSKEDLRKYLQTLGTHWLHAQSLNVRHFGAIRKHTNTPFIKKILLSLCVGRLAKNEIQRSMRDLMFKSIAVNSDAPFIKIALDYIDCIIKNNDDNSEKFFWGKPLADKLVARFPDCLTSEELELKSLLPLIDKRFVIFSLLDKLGIKITDEAESSLPKDCDNNVLLAYDIKSMDIKVKHMHIIFMSAAAATLLNAKDYHQKARSTENPNEQKMYEDIAKRLLVQSEEKHRASYNSAPYCPIIPYNWSRVFDEKIQLSGQEKTLDYLLRRVELLGFSIRNLPTTWGKEALIDVLTELSNYYRDVLKDNENAEKYAKLAEEKKSIEIHPDYINWLNPGFFVDRSAWSKFRFEL